MEHEAVRSILPEQLFELREMLETHSLQHFLTFPMMTLAGCKQKPCSNATGAARQHWQQLSNVFSIRP